MLLRQDTFDKLKLSGFVSNAKNASLDEIKPNVQKILGEQSLFA